MHVLVLIGLIDALIGIQNDLKICGISYANDLNSQKSIEENSKILKIT